MQLPCSCHAVAMQLPCNCHAVAMQLPCRCHAIAMLLPCNCHAAIAVHLPCNCHAFAYEAAKQRVFFSRLNDMTQKECGPNNAANPLLESLGRHSDSWDSPLDDLHARVSPDDVQGPSSPRTRRIHSILALTSYLMVSSMFTTAKRTGTKLSRDH